MIEKMKKHQRLLLIIVIVVCIGSILTGGLLYMKTLRDNLQTQAIQNVMTVTVQQQQAFDNFISEDRRRVHSFAGYFSINGHDNPEEIQQQLTMFREIDATYAVICLGEGWFCSNTFEDILQVNEETMDTYLSLAGSGVRDNYIGPFSGTPRFCYYETFLFNGGHKGLVQKSYDRSKVSEAFSLSFYNDQGFASVINEEGDILLRSVGMTDDHFYENIFSMLYKSQTSLNEMEQFKQALHDQATGSMIIPGEAGDYVYTYVPVKNVEGWYLVSIVPMNAITEEADQILLDSQKALAILAVLLIGCITSALLIRRTHKDMEEKEQEAEYRTQLFDIFTSYISSNTTDIYMMLDHETNVLEYVSPNIKQVLGIDPENAVEALRSSDLDADREATEAYYSRIQAMAPNDPIVSRYTERIHSITGEHKYFLENSYCAVVQGHAKRLIYILDRTKEQQDQQALSEALQMAKSSNQAKSAFLGSVSHDIRTPMNSIIGFLALMRDEIDNPEVVLEYNRRIDAASQHLLELINDVLDMNKIESGSATLNISVFSLKEIIDEIDTIIRPQADAKNQNFRISVSPLTYRFLSGDKLRLNQILINLLSNAVKYTPEKGSIQLQLEEMPQTADHYSHIRFTVSDNGMGMTPDYLKVIFDPFTRQNNKLTNQTQGTGLGMAITRNLVEMMGGTISVESEPDKGSTFTVDLNLGIPEQDENSELQVSGSTPKEIDLIHSDIVKDMHILVVDDIKANQFILVKILSTQGAICDVADNGREAVKMFEASDPCKYDLILMDVQMPVMDGYAATRMIRSSNLPSAKTIPIIAMTANAFVDDVQDALNSGMDAHVAKPVQRNKLLAVIQQVMKE